MMPPNPMRRVRATLVAEEGDLGGAVGRGGDATCALDLPVAAPAKPGRRHGAIHFDSSGTVHRVAWGTLPPGACTPLGRAAGQDGPGVRRERPGYHTAP